MKNKKLNTEKLLTLASAGTSRWELDNITWHDRASNPETLISFLERIQFLENIEDRSSKEERELDSLIDLANDLDEEECVQLLSNDDEIVQQTFIENLARTSALEVLTNDRISFETMNTMCKLSPSDFIITAKRTQDLINSIHELVIQGETLSSDVAGA
jgi:uncharacterized protein YjgD (DUF1641 family)